MKTSRSIIARPRRRRLRAISFWDADGKPDSDKSRNSALGIGVPGTVAGLALALEKYGSGKFTLAQILKPSIELARNGFVVADDMADTLSDMYRRMSRWPNSAKTFSRDDGTPLREGDRLVQADLAATLSAIADQGPKGFYEGPVAEKLAKAIGNAGGIMTADDLKSYQAVIRSAGARQLSRIRHRVDAAALVRRHACCWRR